MSLIKATAVPMTQPGPVAMTSTSRFWGTSWTTVKSSKDGEYRNNTNRLGSVVSKMTADDNWQKNSSHSVHSWYLRRGALQDEAVRYWACLSWYKNSEKVCACSLCFQPHIPPFLYIKNESDERILILGLTSDRDPHYSFYGHEKGSMGVRCRAPDPALPSTTQPSKWYAKICCRHFFFCRHISFRSGKCAIHMHRAETVITAFPKCI